jgi:hypothetical protein
MIKLYFDESGNTGLDLLNKDQPIFCLSSTSLSDEVATELIAPLIRTGQREAKYNRLKGSRKGQADLENFFRSAHLSAENSKFTLADKKYYLITHIVDKLIEPPLHESGIDLYKNDAHVSLTNIWYYTGETIFPGYWNKIQKAFVHAIRVRNRDAFRRFDYLLTEAERFTPVDSRDFATGLLLARGRLDNYIGIYQDIEVFDPAVDLFISLTQKWMEQSSSMHNVTHDQSKPLRRRENFLRTLMTRVSPRIIGYGNRQTELPLRISDLGFEDSVNHPQLQVADIIAGAAVDCLMAWSGRKPAQEYHNNMKDTKLESLFCDGMLPLVQNIWNTNPSRPGEKNLIDGSIEFLSDIGHI